MDNIESVTTVLNLILAISFLVLVGLMITKTLKDLHEDRKLDKELKDSVDGLGEVIDEMEGKLKEFKAKAEKQWDDGERITSVEQFTEIATKMNDGMVEKAIKEFSGMLESGVEVRLITDSEGEQHIVNRKSKKN